MNRCAACSVPLIGEYHTRKFCRPCAEKRERIRRRAKERNRKRPPLNPEIIIKPCDQCQAPITAPKTNKRRFCDDCLLDRRRKKDKGRQRALRKTPAYKAQYRASQLFRSYGLTVDAFDALLQSQDSKCAICKASTPGWHRDWHVDHNHETNTVRGILCQSCNLLLGHAKDDPARLRMAVQYLESRQPTIR